MAGVTDDLVARLGAHLRKLYGHGGVQRNHLAREILSPELIVVWGIDTGDTADRVRATVVRELRILIGDLSEPELQAMLEVAYNLRDDIPDGFRGDFKTRFAWCDRKEVVILGDRSAALSSVRRELRSITDDFAKILAPRYLAALEAEEARRASLATAIEEAAVEHESTTVADSNTAQQLPAASSPAPRKRLFEKQWLQIALIATLLASGIATFKLLPDSTAGNVSPSISSKPSVVLGSYVNLSATITSATAYDGSYDVLFDAGKSAIAEQYRGLQGALPPDAAKEFVNALRDGAFARGGALVTVEVRSLADKDTRVIGMELQTLQCSNDRAREAVRFNARTDLPRVDFGLTVTPVQSPALEIRSKGGDITFGDEYFKQRQRGIRYGAPEQLTMAFKAGMSRCSFNVALKYTVTGEELPAVLLRKPDSDTPFMVSVAPTT